MFIGIVNFCNENIVPQKLVKDLVEKDHKVIMISSKADYYEIIKSNDSIFKWIFSNNNSNTPSQCKLNMKLFELKSKHFFLYGPVLDKLMAEKSKQNPKKTNVRSRKVANKTRKAVPVKPIGSYKNAIYMKSDPIKSKNGKLMLEKWLNK